MSFPEDTSIFIGGLKTDVKKGKLKANLIYLFRQIGLTVKKPQILIVDTNPDYCYAFTNLEDEEAVCLALHHLRTPEHRSHVPFDFSTIHEESTTLKFDSRKKGIKHNDTAAHEQPTKKVPENDVTNDYGGFLSFQQNSAGNRLSPFFSQKSYKIGEQLGSETRNAEFKDGGFMKTGQRRIITEIFGKYVCSFLNTDGGTLYIGVNNYGCVVGIPCNQQEEDQFRLLIDDAIKRIYPPVFPSNYTVQFIPISNENGSLIDNEKVIEVRVDKISGKTQLYDYADVVYIRRDASIQCLKPRELQEWARQQVEKQYVQNKDVGQQLEQVTKQMEKISQDKQEEKDLRYELIQQQFATLKAENYKLKSELVKEKTEDEVMLKDQERERELAKNDSKYKQIEQQFAEMKSENDKLKSEIEEQRLTPFKLKKNRSRLCSVM